MLATRCRLSRDRDDTVVLTLIAAEGSSMCAALAPALIPDLAELLLAETARRRELEAVDRSDRAQG
jgi:hypothetical protein